MIINIIKGLLNYKEILFWTFSLFYLYLSSSYNDLQFTICPLALADLDFCPGCGIGSSIAATMKGELFTAFALHPVGPFALLIILQRIISLILIKIRNEKNIKAIA